MLSLYIGSIMGTIEDTSGLTFQVLPVYYKKDGKFKELRLSTDLPVLDDVEIYFRWWRYFIRLPVSAKLRVSILNFMLFKHVVEDSTFDCYSFACEYAKVPQHNKHWLWGAWVLEPLWWWHLKAGDVVFLFSSPEKNSLRFHHAAIYLGFGRYLSVWGGGGQLEVATLRDMKRDFGAKKAYVVTPR